MNIPDSLVVITDLELAAVNALRRVLKCSVQACFFHLSRCFGRKVQAARMQTRYSQDTEFATQAKMIAALAFVPPCDVESAFEVLADKIDKDLEPVLDHMEDYFIGRQRRRGRANPRYNFWNLYECALQGWSRSNNGQEGWHYSFQVQLGGNHLSLWKVLDGIKREIALGKMRRLHISIGREGKQEAKYQRVTESIEKIAASYDKADVLQYLRSLAHVIEFLCTL